MRLVVLAWGNDARGDDALGPLLGRRLSQAHPDLAVIEDYQLQIEHALDLEGADAVLFLDAAYGLAAPFAFREIAPSPTRAPTTHALAPEAVLQVYAQVEGRAPPPAFTLALRGVSFGLGEGLSVQGEAALAAAAEFCEALLASRTLADWRRLCSRHSSGAASGCSASCSG